LNRAATKKNSEKKATTAMRQNWIIIFGFDEVKMIAFSYPDPPLSTPKILE
jgi:hypothetical protein